MCASPLPSAAVHGVLIVRYSRSTKILADLSLRILGSRVGSWLRLFDRIMYPEKETWRPLEKKSWPFYQSWSCQDWNPAEVMRVVNLGQVRSVYGQVVHLDLAMMLYRMVIYDCKHVISWAGNDYNVGWSWFLSWPVIITNMGWPRLHLARSGLKQWYI